MADDEALEGEWKEQSLWTTISNMAPPSEREELRRLVGPDLVDSIEDLFSEASIMMEIWREYRSETVEQETRKRRLPEPPAMRERLKQEIGLFVSNIRQFQGQAALDQVVEQHKGIIQYATGQASHVECPARPRTSSARSGKEVPVRPLSNASDRTQSRCSTQSLPAQFDRLEIRDNSVDQITLHNIREILEDEKAQLGDDIKLLRESLESERDYRLSILNGNGGIPSIQTLREVRSSLEKQFLQPSLDVRPRESEEASLRPPTHSGSPSSTTTTTTTSTRLSIDKSGSPAREGKRRVLPVVTAPAVAAVKTTTRQMRPSSAQRFRQMVEACRDQDL